MDRKIGALPSGNSPIFLDSSREKQGFEVLLGDCREMMATLEAESVHAIVTDPPYELGFMGKAWDSTGIAYDPEVWRQALRVLKPGGHLLAFSGSRTYHRMACAIEDAGFEIRDQIMWLYGSGFPKSHDVSKAIDREAGAVREVVGLRQTWSSPYVGHSNDSGLTTDKWRDERTSIHDIHITAPATPAAREWSGWGTALKPAHEPIVVARKPFKGTVAQNVLAHGTGALNIDGCRVDGGPSGRWPANVMHDGSDEVADGFPQQKSGSRSAGVRKGMGFHGADGDGGPAIEGSSGSAARFFYVPKASKSDREDGLRDAGVGALRDAGRSMKLRRNNHPTVKPTELMRYLCRLVTPEGGIVLDPFTGSGSTGRGAMLEGFRFLGIEMDPGYREIAIARIQAAAERRTHGDS
jgi:DNA modification methylase